jgi:hypothetical protein
MTNELLPVKRSIIPEVVDEEGRKITSPEMEAVTGLVTQLASLAQLARIRKSLEKEEFEGRLAKKTLSVTDSPQWINLLEESPHKAWITATFYNDGGDTAYIAINKDYDYIELRDTEELPIDFSKADERIRLIYYKCNPGETASVRAVGKY